MQSTMNRSHSIRPRRDPDPARQRFSMATIRSMQGPQLSRKMNRLIKTENAAIGAHETAGRERVSVAAQLSEWGETTEDEAVSDISDKLGVLMAEIGDQEDIFAQNLEDYRAVLKQIRNTEGSVQPSREQRMKIVDEIQRLKYREPNSPRLVTLEQELVRSEAMNLVAEAQLTNVTRQKMKEAFDIHLAAVVERAEKQTILARHARRLLHLLDDTPIVPGDQTHEYKRELEARHVLEEAENDLRSWEKTVEPIPSAEGAGDTSAIQILRSSARNARDSMVHESLVTAQEEQGTDGTVSEAPKEETDMEGVPEAEKEEAEASGALGAQPAAIAS